MTSLWIISFFLLGFYEFAVCSTGSFDVEFDGPQFISYDVRTNRISAETNHISLQFKTFHPSGVLVYGSGTQGDFITLELIQGKLRYVWNRAPARCQLNIQKHNHKTSFKNDKDTQWSREDNLLCA